jgi:DNA-binding MarR family transcriptional regulator
MNENAAFFLTDVAKLIRKRFDGVAREMGATGAKWRVIFLLHRHPGMNQAALAEILEVEPITTCRMVDRLEQAGLAERRRDPRDRRAWRVYLTEKALPLVTELTTVADDLAKTATAGLSDADRAELFRLLGRIRGNLASPSVGDNAQEPKAAYHG